MVGFLLPPPLPPLCVDRSGGDLSFFRYRGFTPFAVNNVVETVLDTLAPVVFQLATGAPASPNMVACYDWLLWGLVLPGVYTPCNLAFARMLQPA